MAPTVTRELEITYGSTTVGGTSDTYQITAGDSGGSKLTISRTYETTTVSFSVLVVAADSAAFAAACSDLEAAFRAPRQRLQIEQGSSLDDTLLDLNPADQTGIDIRSQIQKVGAQEDTGLTRLYRVTVVSGNPADQTEVYDGEAGLRDVQWTVSYSPSRRGRLTINGTYTKLGANDALAQYAAEIDARVSAITTALGGTWELVDEQQTSLNVEDSIMRFTRAYDELIFNQSQGTLNDTRIVRQSLSVGVNRPAPGDSPIASGARRLATVSVAYSAAIDKDETTDLTGLWASTIRPWLVQHVTAQAGLSGAALTEESVRYDNDNNQISASLTILAAQQGDLLTYRLSIKDQVDPGANEVQVWDTNPLSAYVYQGPSKVFRTLTQIRRVVGIETADLALRQARNNARAVAQPPAQQQLVGRDPFALDPNGGALVQTSNAGDAPAGLTFVLKNTEEDVTSMRLGQPPFTLDVTDISTVSTYRLVNVVARTGAGVGPSRVRGARQPAQQAGDQ